MSTKGKFPVYLTPEKKAILERRYQEDGSTSLSGFIENAIDHYLDYLSANDAGLFLPKSIKSVLDGRLGLFEDRMAKLLYKLAVETDMGITALLDAAEVSEEYTRKLRAESVKRVNRTNGRLSFEQKVREREDAGVDDPDGDDEWLD